MYSDKRFSLYLYLDSAFRGPDSDDVIASIMSLSDRTPDAHITVLSSNTAQLDALPPEVRKLSCGQAPTYEDFLNDAVIHAGDRTTLLLNRPIALENDFDRVDNIVTLDPSGLVLCAERLDATRLAKEGIFAFEWSFVGLRPVSAANLFRDQNLRIQVSHPNFAGRLAFAFNEYGSAVYNPIDFTSIAVPGRSSSEDTVVSAGARGGLAYPLPSSSLLQPARLVVGLPTSRAEDVEKAVPIYFGGNAVEASAPFGKAGEGGSDDILVEGSLVAFDAEWQAPAITELHAFRRVRELGVHNPDVAYVAFPWATLIDLIRSAPSSSERVRSLRNALSRLKLHTVKKSRVVTVCQHIKMRTYAGLLRDAGVTDVFWSHADLTESPTDGLVEHPFPLFPVQTVSAQSFERREYLFSFVGAKATPDYLDDMRSVILSTLGDDPRGRIIARERWHFEDDVYADQIGSKARLKRPEEVDEYGDEYREILARSKFALCPSGTGPNSIRLWEAVASGVIPVVISATYRYPGDEALWKSGVLTCEAHSEAIKQLPQRLVELSSDPARVSRALTALKLLAARYGPTRFVSDIAELMAPDRFGVAGNGPIVIDLLETGSWSGTSARLENGRLFIERAGRPYGGQARLWRRLSPGRYVCRIHLERLSHRLEVRHDNRAVAQLSHIGEHEFALQHWGDVFELEFAAAGDGKASVTLGSVSMCPTSESADNAGDSN